MTGQCFHGDGLRDVVPRSIAEDQSPLGGRVTQRPFAGIDHERVSVLELHHSSGLVGLVSLVSVLRPSDREAGSCDRLCPPPPQLISTRASCIDRLQTNEARFPGRIGAICYSLGLILRHGNGR